MATDTIKFKRGVKSKLNNLSYGEPAFISDENELYIGTESGIEKLTSNKEVKELSSQLTQNENVLSTVNNALKNISYDVTMLGVKGDGTDETEIIQNIIDSMPEGCTLLFPANYTFRFSSINITKCININATGSTLIHTVSTDNFIKVNADNVSIVGGKYLLNNIDGIIINNDNVKISSIQCDGGENAIVIRGNNCIISDCISTNASYSSYKIMFSDKTKKDCVTIRNCRAIDFSFKGIVYNGLIGSKKIIIENFVGITNTKEPASDGILIDNGDDDSYCIDEVIMDNVHLYGGESNCMKILNTNNLILRNVYARNEHSKYGSSSMFRLFSKNAYLENINVDERVIASSNLRINGLHYNRDKVEGYDVIELVGEGTIADLSNININVDTLSSYAIRVDRSTDVQHKIVLSNYNAPTSIPIFGIFKAPPEVVGFIEVCDEKLLENYRVTGSDSGDSRIIRKPRTFMANSIPTHGTYKQGDIIYNTSPRLGSNLGWVCTKSGTFNDDDPAFNKFGIIEA